MTGAITAMIYSTAPPASLISLSNQTVSKGGRHTATATYVVNSNGTVTNGTSVLEAWLHTGGVASNYEVRATLQSGEPLTTGTMGSWLACSSTRTWTLTNSESDNSTLTTVMLVEIRLASSGVVQASATITLNATSYL